MRLSSVCCGWVDHEVHKLRGELGRLTDWGTVRRG